MTQITVSVMCQFYANIGVTAQATMEFEAGQPYQAGLVTLASDPWTSTYPG